VRELSNFIERLAITHPNTIVDVTDLPEKFQGYEIPENIELEEIERDSFETETEIQIVDESSGLSAESKSTISQLPEKGMDLKEYLNDMEVNLIQQALDECNGVVAHAAKLLNMRRTTLVEKLRKYELS
jgi:sigma-54 specific flagellar transcriptional regulator A